jgi:hypothetical protein
MGSEAGRMLVRGVIIYFPRFNEEPSGTSFGPIVPDRSGLSR